MATRTSSRSRARSADKVFGCTTPRLFTPPLVRGRKGPCGCGCALTPSTSLGFDVVDFAENVLLVNLFPWQRWLLIHALEVVDDDDAASGKRFRFRKVVVLVGRQNGKSTLSVVLSLWALYRLGVGTVLGTAQDLDTAEEVWSRAVDLVEETDDDEQPVRPQLARYLKQVVRTNGKYAMVLTNRARYKIKAANRRAGRGLSAELILLDELREHQSWDAWAAITKTTNSKPDAQIWCFSNAGDATSVVLRHLRLKAHRDLGDPDGEIARDERMQADIDAAFDAIVDGENELAEALARIADEDGDDVDDGDEFGDSIFLAEWSATPDCDILDQHEWAQANPSLGYMTKIRTIASDAKDDPEWVFRTEVLCQWPRGNLVAPLPSEEWEQTLNTIVEDPDGTKTLAVADRIIGKKVATVAVSHDRSRAHVLFSGRRADGLPQTVVVATMRGVDGVRTWLEAHAAEIDFVTGQARGAQESPLLDEWEADRKFKLKVQPCGGKDLLAAFGVVHDLVRDKKLRHNPQPILDVPARTAATRELTGGKVVDLIKSPCDASPLQGFVIGTYMFVRPKSPRTSAAAATPPALAPIQATGILTQGF